MRTLDATTAPFEPLPEDAGNPCPLCIRKRSYFGVPLPLSVPFFDLRLADDLPLPKGPWGYPFCTIERAAYSSGLLEPHVSFYRTPRIYPLSFDSRDPRYAQETAAALHTLRRILAHCWLEWRQTGRNKPAWIHLGNFDCVVGADRRTTPRERRP